MCGKAHFIGARIRRAPKQAHVGNRMMGSAEGPVRAEGVAVIEQSADAVNLGSLDRLLDGHWRHDCFARRDVECSGAEHWSVPGDELQHQVQRAVQQDLL